MRGSMFGRNQWKQMKKLSPAALFWEKRYRASGYLKADGSPADRQEVLRLVEYTISKHQKLDKEEERKNAARPKNERRRT